MTVEDRFRALPEEVKTYVLDLLAVTGKDTREGVAHAVAVRAYARGRSDGAGAVTDRITALWTSEIRRGEQGHLTEDAA